MRGLVSRALLAHELPVGLLPAACESGRVSFESGEIYHFGLTLVGEARSRAEELCSGLRRLGSQRPVVPAPLLGGNFVLERWEQRPVPAIEAEIAALGGAGAVEIALLSPLRVPRPKGLEQRGATFLNADCFPAEWFLEILWRRLFLLSRGHYPEPAERHELLPAWPAGIVARPLQLSWADVPVRGTRTKGRPYTLGGVRGQVLFEGLTEPWLAALILGGDLRIGQSTHYGLGHYVVEGTADAANPPFPSARRLANRPIRATSD